jgi:hypothetical protein
VTDVERPAATGKGRASRPFLVPALAGALCVAALAPGLASASAAPARLRPPPLACDVDHLTSYAGEVTGYRRGKASTWLRIATDEATVEEVRVPHEGARDARAHYLLRRAPFPASGLGAIERTPGKLRAATRAVAWVCDDGRTPPVIDWQPAGPDAPARPASPTR